MHRPWAVLQPDGIYLDWNATTPPHPKVLAAMNEAAQSAWANPSSVHADGRRARAVLEGLREAIGGALAWDPRNVVITSGGTEANNLALSGAMGLVTSRLEHPSVIAVAERLAAHGRPVHWLPVPESGQLEPAAVASLDASLPEGSWLAIQAANHETGVIQPVRAMAAVARARGLRVHVDAVQAFGKIELPELDLVDTVSIASHKLRGPKGIGALGFRGTPPTPILVGGTQERGLRPGTLDPVAAAGFWVALQLALDAPRRWEGLARLRDSLEEGLSALAQVNGSADRVPHVSNLSFARIRGDELVAALDLAGVRVSSGSACSAGTAGPSPVIQSMLGRERAVGAIRISIGEDVTADQLSRTQVLIVQILAASSPDT